MSIMKKQFLSFASLLMIIGLLFNQCIDTNKNNRFNVDFLEDCVFIKTNNKKVTRVCWKNGVIETMVDTLSLKQLSTPKLVCNIVDSYDLTIIETMVDTLAYLPINYRLTDDTTQIYQAIHIPNPDKLRPIAIVEDGQLISGFFVPIQEVSLKEKEE